MKVSIRGRIFCGLVSLGLFYSLAVCAGGSHEWTLFGPKKVLVNVVVFNYLNRPIYDVYLDGEMVGGSASLSESPYGQFSTVAGVAIPLGPQTLTWRVDGPKGMADNGEAYRVKNALVVTAAQIPPEVRSLGVHIYPDNTAELIFSKDVLEQSERGLGYAKPFQTEGK
ncbi:hypothetical protein [Dyella silvatica]|uniref:hypothetical protein n=1 Tax=Dyella silvatica TaxID=2992128 RepID=UPI00224D1594|nr:hypothetical protein [Dyella silvatica]